MEYIFLAWPFLLVIAATLLVLMGGVLGLHARTRYGSFVLPVLIGLLLVNLAIQPVLSGRDLRTLFFGMEFVQSGYQSASLAYLGKALVYLTLIVSAVEVAHHILARIDRAKSVAPIFLLALVFYFFSAYFLPGIFGKERGLAHFYFYLPLIFSAIYFAAEDNPRRIAICFRNAIGLVLVATIMVAAIQPNMVVQQNFRSAIPIFDFRLWGLAAHPNAFAPLALSFLVLLNAEPFKNSLVTASAWLTGMGAVLFAQSKTVWVVAAFLLVAHHLFRLLSEMRRGRASFLSALIIGGSYLSAVAFCFAVLAWSFGLAKIDMSLLNAVDTKALSTLSGRDIIWEYSIREWKANPIFGYGLDLWGAEYRQAMALPTAYHAHNQFLQTLAASGLIGAIGLIVYVGVLGWGALLVKAPYRPLVLSLLFMLLIRSFSEPPFELRSIADANVIIHLCLFALVVSSARRSRMILNS